MSETARDTLRRLAPTISAGIISADLMNLSAELALVEGAGVGVVHFDVMDGVFCPMMTLGPPIIKAVRTNMLKDVHLMISNPLSKLADYVAAGADILTVHVESEPTHIHRVFQLLGSMTNSNDPARGIVRGVALNPGTPVEAIRPILDDVELVTLLGINPGWGGQKLLPSMAERVAEVRDMIDGRSILICLDGGVTRENISEIAAMGPDLVVAGSAVFDGKNAAENAKTMLKSIKNQH
ncbi:MAG: ribulose-phosphate 3-epimerase [Armatimonadetes bacterium]|nr:ribulose-phosphate 3-epimerase [Armatimonadota bacterium]